MKLKLKAVISDLDGVVRHFPIERDHRIETFHQLPLGTVGRIAFEKNLLSQVITGQITDKEWREKIQNRILVDFPNVNSLKVVTEWSDFHGEIDLEVLNYLLGIAPGTPLALLTNATDRLGSDLRKANVTESFAHIFNSSEIGHAKPSVEIFEIVAERLNAQPSELLFIDDSITNVTAAENIGFVAIQFSTLSALRRDLAELLG